MVNEITQFPNDKRIDALKNCFNKKVCYFKFKEKRIGRLDYMTEAKEVSTYLGKRLGTEKITDKKIDPEQLKKFSLEEYRNISAMDLAQKVRDGLVTKEQLIDYALAVIEETNPELNNVISLRVEKARKEAAEMEDTGQPFYGVPLLVKGMGHEIAGESNTFGLSFTEEFIADETSSFVEAFRKAGFIILGQTSFPQFAWINVTTSDLYGPTRNPWNLEHNPGGSSGGSTAAVAAGQVPIATSSDAGGSIRIPASFSGLVGHFPTRGILGEDEEVQTNQTANFVNTKTVKDTEGMFDYLLKDKFKGGTEALPKNTLDKETTIAYTLQTPAGTPLSDDAREAVKNAVAFLEEQGFQTEKVDYPIDGEKMMMQYYVIAASATAGLDELAPAFLQRTLQEEDVELLTWGLYQLNQKSSEEKVNKAWETLHEMEEKVVGFYEKYPIFLTPTTAYPAPEADYHHIPDELRPALKDMSELDFEESLQLIYDQWLPAWVKTPYTQLSNLTGTPSISLPTHVTKEGLPLGIMFGATHYDDYRLLEIGKLFEENNQFKLLTF